MMMTLEKTEGLVKGINRIFDEVQNDIPLTEDEKFIFNKPAFNLAKTIYMDNPVIAEELAKYLCILCDIKKINVEIYVDEWFWKR